MYSVLAARTFRKRIKNGVRSELSEYRTKLAIRCTSSRAWIARLSNMFDDEGGDGEEEAGKTGDGDGAEESKDMMISKGAFFADADFFFGGLRL